MGVRMVMWLLAFGFLAVLPRGAEAEAVIPITTATIVLGVIAGVYVTLTIIISIVVCCLLCSRSDGNERRRVIPKKSDSYRHTNKFEMKLRTPDIFRKTNSTTGIIASNDSEGVIVKTASKEFLREDGTTVTYTAEPEGQPSVTQQPSLFSEGEKETRQLTSGARIRLEPVQPTESGKAALKELKASSLLESIHREEEKAEKVEEEQCRTPHLNISEGYSNPEFQSHSSSSVSQSSEVNVSSGPQSSEQLGAPLKNDVFDEESPEDRVPSPNAEEVKKRRRHRRIGRTDSTKPLMGSISSDIGDDEDIAPLSHPVGRSVSMNLDSRQQPKRPVSRRASNVSLKDYDGPSTML